MILVSALGPNSSIFLFWRTFIQLGDLLGRGLGPGLGPGLDNKMFFKALIFPDDVVSIAVHCSL